MYRVNLLGLNTRSTDRDIKDGFLQESINLQRRDGAFRPIPERIISTINASGYTNIILHKVADENQINVLGFKSSTAADGANLAMDLAGFLGGAASGSLEILTWFGTITDGVYASRSTVGSITNPLIPIFKTDNMSFTILNGIAYFMSYIEGDVNRTYYMKLQYNQTEDLYETKNMYLWKVLVPFFPLQDAVQLLAPKSTYNSFSKCGVILIRFAVVLKSGEVVLPSPIYAYEMFGINRSSTQISKGDLIENIHTIVNMNLDYGGLAIFDQEISAINVYASTPYYETKFSEDGSGTYDSPIVAIEETIKGETGKKAEEPFYLIKTINEPTDDKILLSVDQFDGDITYSGEYSKIDISTIAAGEVMPVDNFSYHHIYGKITSHNGRLIIESPVTVLSKGHISSLALEETSSDSGFKIDTEDGSFDGIAYDESKALGYSSAVQDQVESRGILSYPDAQANLVGGSIDDGGEIRLFRARRNVSHNLSCAFGFDSIGSEIFGIQESGDNARTSCEYSTTVIYYGYDEITDINQTIKETVYSSENRAQFSAAGEFSVFPAINSYRIGEGKIINIGANNVNPKNAEIVAGLVVGTSDGLYTINTDPAGNNLVASITKVDSAPYISEEVLLIKGAIVFLSDKGLMVFNGGELTNLTENYFTDQGNGNFPVNETVFPNYNVLTNNYFGGANPYTLIDIVEYLGGAIFAYDGRRNTIWCSNPNEDFSLVYSIENKIWGMSTLVFSERIELFSILGTSEGDIYSRYLVKKSGEDNLLILSGEDMDTEVFYHFLTRPIKLQNPDSYKKIKGLHSRCELFRDSGGTGYFSFGAWGKQDHNKKKKGIPIFAKSDNRAVVYPDDVRQDIPTGWAKGKYKSVVVLQGGLTLPDSSIDRIDFDGVLVDNARIR